MQRLNVILKCCRRHNTRNQNNLDDSQRSTVDGYASAVSVILTSELINIITLLPKYEIYVCKFEFKAH